MFTFCSRQKSRVLRRSVIGSDLHFKKIIGGARIIGERESYLSPLRSHAAGDGDSGSDDFPSLGTYSEISGHQSSFAYHSLIGLKRFLVCILVRLPARWLGAETEAKVYPAMHRGFCCCAVLFCSPAF